MADKLEISVRTVYRYIDALCASGAPIVSEPGHGGGFRLLPSFDDGVPLFFDRTELKAMFHSLLWTRQADYPYADSLQSALRKIDHRLQEAEREELKRQTSAIDAIPHMSRSSVGPVLKRLEQAVTERQTVSIRYAKSERGETSERLVNPYGLLFRLNAWYLAAYCHLRQAERIFRVDRVREAEFTGETFERPERYSVREAYLRSVPEPETEGAPVTVILRSGNESILDQICNQWFLRKYVAERADREARFSLPQETMMKYMPYLLLSFGQGVRVVEPASLRKALSELARDLAAFYESAELP